MLNLIQHLRYTVETAQPNKHDQTATEILNQVQDDKHKCLNPQSLCYIEGGFRDYPER